MSETKEELVKTKAKEKIDKSVKSRAVPKIFVFTNRDDKGYEIEVYLPGVEKDSIELKLIKDYIIVYGETKTLIYSGSYNLCCPGDVEKAYSTYKDGLLKIHVPIQKPELYNGDVKVE